MRAILFAALLALTSSLACNAIPKGAVTKTAPVVQTISPTVAPAGTSQVMLSVSGKNFKPTAKVLWNGRRLLSYTTSDGLIRAAITKTQLNTPGTIQVVVQNPSGEESEPVSFTVAPSEIAPNTNSSTGSTTTTTPSSPLVITTASLSPAVVGTSYTATMSATGGVPAYSWSLESGFFPTGMMLSPSGVVSGLPSQPGTFSFTVRVSDAASSAQSATKAFSMTVTAATAPLAITTSSVASGTTGKAYSATVAASGGTMPYGFSMASGTLPTGVSLASNGTIAGTPTQSGSFSFTVRATDAASPAQSATKTFGMTVAAAPVPLVITSTSVPDTKVGSAYSATMAASGGTTPYSFTLASGSLPAGLALATNGSISGTATASGVFNFTLQAKDSAGQNATKVFGMTVAAAPVPLVITSTSVPDTKVGSAYSATMAASGGTTPYSFTLASGSLPAGLALATNGSISGTATASGVFNFTLQAKDSAGQTATKAFGMTVAAAPVPLV
ncbi:MAG: putative Ig domain-containing protein, partial [Candidatus Korobacteraceae bacterium]